MSFRGVFEYEKDPPYWKEATKNFPNYVPRFETKEEAIKFTEKYCSFPSNSDDPKLMHSIAMLTTWDQIMKHVLPLLNTNQLYSKTSKSNHDNVFMNPSNKSEFVENSKNPVYEYLLSRVNLPIHQTMSSSSTLNTLRYLFFHMRCGILVMIRNNKIKLFCPFVNKDYTNNWNGYPEIESENDDLEQYYRNKGSSERFIADKSKWWANGNIICNVYDNQNQWWGDQFLFQLKDMIAETCNNRVLPDCDFFINKRDYPQLKYNMKLGPVEPYGFIFNKDDRDPEHDIILTRHSYASYAPILSFYSSHRFADIPIPPTEDWEAATGQVFPSSFIHTTTDGKTVVASPRDLFTKSNLDKFDCEWNDKVNTAFFRGTATGGGTTIETNQRLHLAQICYDWSFIPELNGSESFNEDTKLHSNDTTPPVPYLDAKITGWNMRDKKIANRRMTYVRRTNFKFAGDRATNFVEIYKQSRYKYVIYVEGHCAACRYAYLMRLGSVILKVDSMCVADSIWYFPLLRPHWDYVPVKSDLSDLREKIEWCRNNDIKCREIAKNARMLYDRFISRDGILDYMQSVLIEISNRTISAPDYGRNAPLHLPLPTFPSKCSDTCNRDKLCQVCERRKNLRSKQEQDNNNIFMEEKKSREEALRKRREKNLEQVRLKRQKL